MSIPASKPTRANESWTPSQDNRLKKLIKEGKNTAQIAEELGRTKNSITNRRYILNKGKKAKSPVTNATTVSAASLGEEVNSIAKDTKKAVKETYKTAKKKFAPAVKSTVKEAKKRFAPIGKQVDTLLKKAFKHGISVTITIGNEEEK